jgi:hypothetical protein
MESILHNIGVLIVGFGVAFIGTRVDVLFQVHAFHSLFATAAGLVLLALGFLLRRMGNVVFLRESYEGH